MTRNPIRRAQLIAPFGVGAMMTVRDGTSMICGGLDHWYRREDGSDDSRDLDENEFKIEEWRLQQRLGVSHFRLPPDYRTSRRNERIPNIGLKIPLLRFPRWHFCPRCTLLHNRPLAERGRIKCPDCERKGEKSFLAQVRFVAVCDHGHIQDFPWREWAHGSEAPECQRPMRLVGTGGASLGSILVKCECGMRRSLSGIMNAAPGGESTTLSDTLIEGGSRFLCRGKRPWLGTDEPSPCDRPLRGSLRNASNVYFALTRSSIYLPRGSGDAPQDLIELLEGTQLSQFIELLSSADREIMPGVLRGQYFQILQQYSDEQIEAALDLVVRGETESSEDSTGDEVVEDEDRETSFRRAEFAALQNPRREPQLSIQEYDTGNYGLIGKSKLENYFSRIMLVDRLRETTALAGFHRIFAEGPEDEQSLEEQRKLLWKNPPVTERWLPAHIVYGEGLFLQFDEALLQAWEQETMVSRRVNALSERYRGVQQERHLQPRPITPRLVLLHTFAHLVMNRLTFECGYGSAALRERLYVSDDLRAPMAGILVYTASGDSEGTLGGLVRMGKPGYLEPVIRRAQEGARWCSTDPICMEMGQRGGQGPDSCNLAACHSCALVPETACEEFNRFLDRALVIGDTGGAVPGFFEYSDGQGS